MASRSEELRALGPVGIAISENDEVFRDGRPTRLLLEVVAQLPLEPIGLLEAGGVPHPPHERLAVRRPPDLARRSRVWERDHGPTMATESVVTDSGRRSLSGWP